jgi:hypothetical protein
MIPDAKASISQSLPQSPFVVYDDSQMRRALSILFALLFGFGPLSATLGASDDTSLPACCRRHGAHHCAMPLEAMGSMQPAGHSAPAFTAPSHCPLYPDDASLATQTHALLALAAGLPVLLAHPNSFASSCAAARLSQIRTRSGRAPPSTFRS